MIRIDLTLRTQQVRYLRQLAGRDDISISQAFRQIIEAYAAPDSLVRRRSLKERKHVMLGEEHLKSLDELAVREGLTRSDAARRLIDKALAIERGT